MRSPVCDSLAAEMQQDVDRQNRCRVDSDCTTFNLLTCPAMCGRPTARMADPSKVAALLLEYNRTDGCHDCNPACPPSAPRTHCVLGLCATDATVPTDCPSLEREMGLLTRSVSCLEYADCAFIDYQGPQFQSACGSSVSRDAAPRLAQLTQAWRSTCCADCPGSCTPTQPLEFARCDTGHCITAADCGRKLRSSMRGWTIVYRTRPGTEATRALLVQDTGLAVVSPPGVESMLGDAEREKILALADKTGLLCLDGSFHANGAITLELTAGAPDVGSVDIRYADPDPRPTNFADLEQELMAIMTRLAGP
jgi:hypothetical protein